MINSIESEIIEKFRNAGNRLVLLDYDGTLVNYTKLPEKAQLPESMVGILNKFICYPLTDIFIVTGRSHFDIDRLLQNLPVKVVAEHGAFLKENGSWKCIVADNSCWKQQVLDVMYMFPGKCPGTYIEQKEYSITWHYRTAEANTGYECSRHLITLLKDMVKSYNLRILDGNKVVEVLSNEIGKGLAVKKLYENGSFDFVLSIGDDATDEEMFEYFLHVSGAYTIKVGDGSTSARYKFHSISDVATLLKKLTA